MDQAKAEATAACQDTIKGTSLYSTRLCSQTPVSDTLCVECALS